MTSPRLIVKRTIKSAAAKLKGQLSAGKHLRRAVHVFAYHRVVADLKKAESESFYGLVVSTETFRRHCEILKASYNVVSLESAVSVLKGKRQAHRPLAVITFDDGYLDFYEQAFPVLKDLGLPATMFLPTECIGSGVPLAHDRIFWLLREAMRMRVPVGAALERASVPRTVSRSFSNVRYLPALTEMLVHLPSDVRENAITGMERILPDAKVYPPEYRLLDWHHILEMADAGVSFGGHTANHVVLPLESENDSETEILRSKAGLEARLGRPVTSFAYPNGEYNPTVRRLVAKAGYSIAVTTQKKINYPGTDPLAIGRFSLCEESTRGIKGVFSPSVAALRLGVISRSGNRRIG
ncbi:MAG: polysaccharide deacetylase family protein [Pyrinomonadaceae bacterium]